jgi:PPM family protein phosphatase
LKYGVMSDKGMHRDTNEDSYDIIAGFPGLPAVFVIADGMGGHSSGEIASRTAVDFINARILGEPELLSDGNNVAESIVRIMDATNSHVFSLSQENPELSGMGTTLTMAVVYTKWLYIGHVGDSRAYLYRNGSLDRLTTDHSYVEELIRSGNLTREEAKTHPRKNVITRALGCQSTLEVDNAVFEMRQNDTFLICTDGLTNMLSDEEITAILEEYTDPQECSKKLVDTANQQGGADNITVLVFKQE